MAELANYLIMKRSLWIDLGIKSIKHFREKTSASGPATVATILKMTNKMLSKYVVNLDKHGRVQLKDREAADASKVAGDQCISLIGELNRNTEICYICNLDFKDSRRKKAQCEHLFRVLEACKKWGLIDPKDNEYSKHVDESTANSKVMDLLEKE